VSISFIETLYTISHVLSHVSTTLRKLLIKFLSFEMSLRVFCAENHVIARRFLFKRREKVPILTPSKLANTLAKCTYQLLI
jgi:hypothetical protein